MSKTLRGIHESGIPPWHLWGNSLNITLTTTTTSGTFPSNTQQLVKIAYKRPENWRFFFAADFLSTDGGFAAGTILAIDFDLIIGVGRSTITILGFEEFDFKVGTDVPGGGVTRWSSAVVAPDRGVAGPPTLPPDSLIVDHIVGQDINIQARVTADIFGPPVNASAAFTVHCNLAPNVHVRPEWGIEEFHGGETGGR